MLILLYINLKWQILILNIHKFINENDTKQWHKVNNTKKSSCLLTYFEIFDKIMCHTLSVWLFVIGIFIIYDKYIDI